jgi:hypothetical protein
MGFELSRQRIFYNGLLHSSEADRDASLRTVKDDQTRNMAGFLWLSGGLWAEANVTVAEGMRFELTIEVDPL